ncbi:hypothetical protein JSY36_03365 [Bacillus sp. H-16]|nr:hypothetical protein [Alteribacter salitolerans]
MELVTKAQVEQLDEQAKGAGLMIGIPGELYTATISNISSLYIERINGRWEVWRETHYPGQSEAISRKTIGTGSKLEDVLPKVKRYLDYIASKKGSAT